MGLDLYCATSQAQHRYMVKHHSGYAVAGFAASTSTTKGGEDVSNPTSEESEQDSLPDTDLDESQGSESDNDSEEHHSEDQQSAEDDASTSTTDAKKEAHERHLRDPNEENFNRETP